MSDRCNNRWTTISLALTTLQVDGRTGTPSQNSVDFDLSDQSKPTIHLLRSVRTLVGTPSTEVVPASVSNRERRS
jgi:hypothetical protein